MGTAKLEPGKIAMRRDISQTERRKQDLQYQAATVIAVALLLCSAAIF
jgi:hypothetical protein